MNGWMDRLMNGFGFSTKWKRQKWRRGEGEVTSRRCRRGNLKVVQVEASVSKVGRSGDGECGLWMVVPSL